MAEQAQHQIVISWLLKNLLGVISCSGLLLNLASVYLLPKPFHIDGYIHVFVFGGVNIVVGLIGFVRFCMGKAGLGLPILGIFLNAYFLFFFFMMVALSGMRH